MDLVKLLGAEVILGAAGLILLTIDFCWPRRRALMTGVSYMAAIAALAVLVGALSHEAAASAFLSTDALTFGFSLLVILGTMITLALSQEDPTIDRHWGSYLALLLFASAGGLLLLKARDFVYVFLSLELISIASFILVAFDRKELWMIEGALKYFLVGAFSSAIGLYGISLIYAATGQTSFDALGLMGLSSARASSIGWIGLGGLLMVLVSFCFKASIAPFHFWVPDAYQAAPTPFTAYLSVVPKVVALGIFSVLLSFSASNMGPSIQAASLAPIIAVLACLTMTIGNLSAIHQTDLKRFLAYSSIAQAGYMLIGVLSASRLGGSSILVYGFGYLLMNFGAFAVVQWVARARGSYEISSMSGLAQTHFPMALAMACFLLSLAGIPPFIGFLGKYYVFASVIESQWAWWVAVVAVLNSVISVYYYLRIVYYMFFSDPFGRTVSKEVSMALLSSTVFLLLAGTVAFGVYPRPLLRLLIE
ncbi:MAG: NADH-quinone oxidoreductase subunit N [Elusimicrobia bacterium]|nr:NADH-quinone oxidoreductase subunit N [Elusimicrobiota bacterium]